MVIFELPIKRTLKHHYFRILCFRFPASSLFPLTWDATEAFGNFNSKGLSSSIAVTLWRVPLVVLITMIPSWVQQDRIPKWALALINMDCLGFVKNSFNEIEQPFRLDFALQTLDLMFSLVNLTRMGLLCSWLRAPSLWHTFMEEEDTFFKANLLFSTFKMTEVQSSPSTSVHPWKSKVLRRCRVSRLSICFMHSPICVRSSPSMLKTNSLNVRNSSATLFTVSFAGPADWICVSSSPIFRVKFSSKFFWIVNISASWDMMGLSVRNKMSLKWLKVYWLALCSFIYDTWAAANVSTKSQILVYKLDVKKYW